MSVLRRADRGLALRDPGEYLYSRDVSEDVVRTAADRLTQRILRRVAGVDYSFLFTMANAFTSLSYETCWSFWAPRRRQQRQGHQPVARSVRTTDSA